MANYGYGDLSGLFGDKYSTQASLNDAMIGEAHSFGQLSPYGMGQASTYYQAAGGGTPLNTMLTQANPMMQRQNILDELQKKHPNPDTPEKLMALASDLSTNGFGDMAMKVRQAAMELQSIKTSSAAATLAANTPPDSAFTRLKNSLSNKMITKEMIHGYMQHGQWNSTDGSTYGAWGSDFKMQSVDDAAAWYNQYKYDFAEAKKELEGEIENWAIDYQAQSPIMKDLNELLQNPDRQVIMFENTVGLKGMTTAGQYLTDQTFVVSSVKKKGLEDKSDDSASVSMDALSGATSLPASSLTNNNQTLAMNERTWMDDIEENFNFIPSGIPT